MHWIHRGEPVSTSRAVQSADACRAAMLACLTVTVERLFRSSVFVRPYGKSRTLVLEYQIVLTEVELFAKLAFVRPTLDRPTGDPGGHLRVGERTAYSRTYESTSLTFRP